jgi:SH3-like domain-containing protein
MVKRLPAVLAILAGCLLLAPAGAQPRRQAPYFASIAASRAMMRTGPGRTYPGIWLYVRADLPIRVVEIYRNWRKVEDPDGTQGWMLVNLLSDTRTAIVRGAEPQPMRASPDGNAAIRFRAAPGVVGRISRCGGGWCRLDVRGRDGYIRTDAIWGVGPAETVD